MRWKILSCKLRTLILVLAVLLLLSFWLFMPKSAYWLLHLLEQARALLPTLWAQLWGLR